MVHNYRVRIPKLSTAVVSACDTVRIEDAPYVALLSVVLHDVCKLARLYKQYKNNNVYHSLFKTFYTNSTYQLQTQ